MHLTQGRVILDDVEDEYPSIRVKTTPGNLELDRLRKHGVRVVLHDLGLDLLVFIRPEEKLDVGI